MNQRQFAGLIALLTIASCACLNQAARADVRLQRLFTDNMVLQRDRPVPVWGWATPGEAITVQFGGGLNLTAKADKTGRWEVRLPALDASATPRDLTVQGKNLITLKNVLVGDVWLCSGQSNMQFPLAACNMMGDIQSADLPQLRFFTVPMVAAERPHEDITTRDAGLRWNVCTPQTAGGLSAVAYYFGRKINQEAGVPIGLLVSSVGGTNIEKWMPQSSFTGNMDLSSIGVTIDSALAEYRDDMARYLPRLEAWTAATKKALKLRAEIPEMPEMPIHPLLPGSKAGGNWVHLYNGMIHPLGRYPIRGAIWYQGENNGDEYEPYVSKLTRLIRSWRDRWGYDFPFYYVQLANWLQPTDDPSGGPSGWQHCRQAQFQCLSIPKTGMAVTIDIGEAGDIHPKDKFDVGERLARWALVKDYGKTGIMVSGPLYKSMKVEDNRIEISFDYVGDGLMMGKKEGRSPLVEVRNTRLERFSIAGRDRVWHWANAVIHEDRVIVSSPAVPHPVAVRYAYAMNPEGCNLYNRAGLPASPFRTDRW